jgi:uncharacterized repeat protein (TIGR03803 family)
MTKLLTLGPSSFALTHSRKARGKNESCFAWAAVCIAVFCLMAAIAAPAQTFTPLLSFDGTNGSIPHYGYLVQGIDGDLYGMTGHGATDGCGTAFKMTTAGTLTTLFNFADGVNGCHPDGGLMLATDGDIYGSTTDSGDGGGGTLWKVNPSGTLSTIHEFSYPDGGNPNSALVEAPNGVFYGTTVNGGHGISCCDGGGVVFKMTPAGAYSVVHFFDFTDGWDPQDANLVQGTDGNFYGEAAGGGTFSCAAPANGCGVLYKIGPLGVFTVVHEFEGSDGDIPYGGLVQASDGNFYGTTYYGGAHGDGTVFRFTPSGALTTIYNFSGSDGAQPHGHLIQATDGNLYGTTYAGGANGDGTVFHITLGGTLTTLHNFDGTDGAESQSGLAQHTNGMFYGETDAGGTSGNGVIFSLSMGLGPFVTFIRDLGIVGATAQILGQGFTDATAVSFNGTPATFNVESDTYMTATVPAGATTGYITVTETGGTLTSNKVFRVPPQIFSFTPTSGPVGTSVVITGESLSGASALTFACKWHMSFTVDSDTQITAIIPAEATTGTSGTITVRTPGGTSESSDRFTVTD